MEVKPTYEELERRIQELEQIESELKYSREMLRVYEKASLGYQSLDDNGRYIAVNQTWQDTLGYAQEEVIGKSFADFIHPDWQDNFKENFQRFKSLGEVLGVEFAMVKKNGDLIQVSLTGNISRNTKGDFQQTHCIFHDITGRKRTEEVLRENTQFLQTIIDTTSDLVSVTDMEGNFKFIGSSYSILGYDPGSLVGRNVMDLVHPDDYQDIAIAFAEFLTNREDGRKVEYRYRRTEGNYLWFETVGKFILDDAGNPKEILFSSRDVTARKQAEGELKRIEWMLSREPVSNIDAPSKTHDQGYGDLTELNRDGIILKSIGHERLKSFANDYLDLLGTSSAIYEVNGDYAFGIFASGWCRMMDSASRKLCDTADNVDALSSGRWLCHESCWTDCSQEAIAKRAPVDIECKGGIRLHAVPIFAGENVIGVINFGYGDPPKDPEKLKMLADVYHLNHDDLLRKATAYDSRPPYIIAMAKKRLNSTAKLIGSMVETKQAMDALRENENQISSIFRSAPVGIGSVVNRVLIKVNNRLCEMTGYDEEDLIGHSSRMLYPSDEDFEFVGRGKYAQIADHGTGMVETRWLKYDGTIIDVLLSSTPVDLQDHSRGVTFTALDITERKQAGKALAQKSKLLEKSQVVANLGSWEWDIVHDTWYFSAQWKKIHGVFDNVLDTSKLIEIAHPEDAPYIEKAFIDAKEQRKPYDIEHRIIRADNRETRYIKAFGEVEFDQDTGRPVRMVGTAQDITERKQYEAEREKLQDQLHQAQKMETVGRLAGGVAHDFNNMLGVILGYSEMTLEQVSPGQPMYKALHGIQQAAQRSADLTRQLLTFARKQTIAPKQIDLNETVEGMFKMLRRLIGEDIDMIWLPGRNLHPVKMDPTQINQILANLCVNARDAIEGVGKVTIETSNTVFDAEYCARHAGFLPGEYVLLAVSDNGCGMDRETISHLFEPFFTTKEQGKGTGLGLASVYGAVKQNNGFINVYSEPGQGTTFKIYLPQYAITTEAPSILDPAEAAARGHETILLVEDEATILEMTTMMLKRQGHTVLAAATPNEAIRLAEAHTGRIDLLITDVVMPKMNGRDLARNILSLYPDMKYLFMSGYTANFIAHHGVLDEGVHFIQKPFSKNDLTVKVREVLDRD